MDYASRRIALALAVTVMIGVIATLAHRGVADSPVDHAVYFAVTPSNGLLTPANIQRNIEAMGFVYTLASTWQAVLDADGSEEIDALIADSGSVMRMDGPWVRSRYQRGMVVAGINVNTLVLENLLDDPMITSEIEPSTYSPPGREYWSAAFRNLLGTPLALTAIAQDPTILDEGGLPTPETATQYESFKEQPATLSYNGTPYDATDLFYDDIAGGIWQKNGRDPADRP
jgi:hypothetical protein